MNYLNSGTLALFKSYNEEGKFVDIDLTMPDPRLEPVIEQVHFRWDEAKKFVVNKNFDPSIKFVKEIKKHGEFLNRLFFVLERVVSFEGGSDPINVWNECVADLELFEIIGVLEGIMPVNNSFKKGFIGGLRSDLKALKNNKNPFVDKKLGNQVIVFFIEKAIEYKRQSKPFYLNYWKPFLSSFSAHITEIDKSPNYKRAYIEENPRGIFYTLKKGKGKSPSSTKKFKLDF